MERYEFLILSALDLPFGLSFLSFSLGFSAATVAFLAGVILAGTKFSDEISILMAPTGKIFVTIFFVAIGTLMYVRIISPVWEPISKAASEISKKASIPKK